MKITFMGAGSTVFAKNVLGDCIRTDAINDGNLIISLYDIDGARLEESYLCISSINNTYGGKAKVEKYLDVANRKDALRGADFVVNAIQVGGYIPCTVTDFEIPKKYGLKQTIADTLGIGGIFRALRTIPVMLDFASDMESVCPNAWFLNYTNPMAMLTGAMLRYTNVKTVGLCHSVQACVEVLLSDMGMRDVYDERVQWKIAGINHQSWLLEVSKDGKDLYPEIKRRAEERLADRRNDLVRLYLMKIFGYYVTESSEHSSEYMPYFIKGKYPELIEKFNIPLDEYPRRCIRQIEDWNGQKHELISNPTLEHGRTGEYASYIIEAMATNKPYSIGGNVLNTGLITNLPQNACVEVKCVVDASGVTPTYVGKLPEQLAALNRTNINPQLLTIKAAMSGKIQDIYHAALLDPHTSAELSIDDIIAMCDELYAAHKRDGYL